MGSGKSTFGPKLADALDIPFADLDDEFEARHKISIQDFFSKYGEKLFRDIEHRLLAEEAISADKVIATGGGTPCFSGNMELMNKSGITVYLKVPFEVLMSRLTGSHRKRPMLMAFSEDDFERQLLEHLLFRETFYNQANIIIDGLNPDPREVARLIRQTAFKLSMPE